MLNEINSDALFKPESGVAGAFIETVTHDGILEKIRFKNEDKFNFGFDIVDAIAAKLPDKTAMVHVSNEKEERRLTFADISKNSSKAANYFKSLGIKKGDHVMLVLKRHYQFWYAITALHKLGAVVIPTTNLLVTEDFIHRFNAGEVSAIVCTADGKTAGYAEEASRTCPGLRTKILVTTNASDGADLLQPECGTPWHDFNKEVEAFSDEFPRPEDAACGDDPMLMFFTSGTTAYPKIAVHNYKYPLGHFITAKYWHHVDPDGLHFTISDTGWGKALWGKLYGQWMCEAAIFTYDFNNFEPKDILAMFEKYHITTFCAPPTMYRFIIKLDMKKYDLSALKYATVAGEALNPEVFNRFYEATGLKLMEGFGQTETTLSIANLYGMEPKPGSMGKPTPLYDIDIQLSDGTSAPVGETGEIVIRTSDRVPDGLFAGYYNDEEKTAAAWHDGYYHTGDTAYRDEDGYFWYVGRVDDLIKSAGYRIGPFEIENVIMELPYVVECAVTAQPDETRGQTIKATIVLTEGTEGTPKLKKEILAYVRKHMAAYKWPRIIEFAKELPKTISGKVRRVELK